MKWFNEPPAWEEKDGVLTVTTGEKTDFWRSTFYGHVTNDGHVRYTEKHGDFSAEVTFEADYAEHYDQAGLMIRFADDLWVKAGIEYSHGVATLSTVYTRYRSDWALGPVVSPSAVITVRLSRAGAAICAQARVDGGAWQTLRLGFLSDAPVAQVGPMTCSPTRAGLVARFRDFHVGPLVDFTSTV